MKRWSMISWLAAGALVATAALAVASCDEGPDLDVVEIPLDDNMGRSCGTPDPSPAEQDRVQRALDEHRAMAGRKKSAGTSQVITIPVYLHEIRNTNGAGRLDADHIAAQIAVLDTGFAGEDAFTWDKDRKPSDTPIVTPFRFELVGHTITVNRNWFNAKMGSSHERNMKQSLRVGGPETLNIYSTSGGGYLGWATFPWGYSNDPTYDGVVVAYDSLPSVRTWAYGHGRTATHEVGHWLGLYHTFQGGCTGDGDNVDDTNAQQSYNFGCPSPAPQTCDTATPDPIHNYMDYTDDLCMYVFTGGQSDRSLGLYDLHRRPPAPQCTTAGDCDDDNACTIDTCNDGSCGHTTVVCSTNDQCKTAVCDPKSGCGTVSKANFTACDDGNACTTGETCQAGECNGGVAVVCDDGDPCTSGQCVGGACDFQPANDNEPCAGGDQCNTGVCSNGICELLPVDDHKPCEDGDACTASGACLDGVCVSGDVTCEPAIHLGQLSSTSINNGNTWTAVVTVTVHDAGHDPVAGATVSGTWNGNVADPCTTTGSGQCSVTLAGTRKNVSSVSFNVTGVTGGNSGAYDEGLNDVGATIVVPKP